MDADKILIPCPPNEFLTNGTITVNAKKPYTMEGIPAIKFKSGFKNLYRLLLQSLAKKAAHNIPIGIPIAQAKNVIKTDP